ncbi:hypothetical protein X768_16600 [Mesorhizobium sp. LSJC265A00]|uniref:hypothetical protein n=1 Tax=Mesorhizobium sp. LSJC265A00 TaxID=1287322 RepID=UPI0003CE3ACA|nr:hypothetical protein [Mesorhizobium sp. LSJC265A00]ESX09967.1 hypothetical protein X768_16600 [Mesorhizobium sp. LSJC265A00]
MAISEMIDYVVEAQFSIYTAGVRAVLHRHYIACFVDRILPREVFDELVEECGEDIMSPSGNDAKDVYHFAKETEEWDGDADAYYEPTKRCLHEALELREQLTNLPTDELKPLYDNARLAMEAALKERRRRAEIDAFFNRAEAAADYDYWSGIAVLTPEEGTALSFGKDPRLVNASTLAECLEDGSPFAEDFKNRLRRLERAVEAGALKMPIRTEGFLAWAVKNLSGEQRFLEWCQTFLAKPTDPTPVPAEAGDVGFAVAKLLVGMAMQKYGFSKTYGPSEKSDAFQKIVDDLATAGLNIDVKSVRKHIGEANKLLHERGDFGK